MYLLSRIFLLLFLFPTLAFAQTSTLPTSSLVAAPGTITPGSFVGLKYSCGSNTNGPTTSASLENGDRVLGTLNHDPTTGAFSGIFWVAPAVTTTYTLICKGPGGSSSATATFTVVPLSASPASIPVGGMSALSYGCAADATSASLSGDPIQKALNGMVYVTPKVTTTYALICTKGGVSTKSLATVTVTPPVTFALPPVTTVGIHLGQVFDSRIGQAGLDPTHIINDEIGLIDYVWGASKPVPKAAYTTFYDPLQENPDPTQGIVPVNDTHTISWFKANHPDWIEYTCAAAQYKNQASAPDSDIAWEFGEQSDKGQWTPIDVDNPQVLNYLLATYFEPAIQAGYKGVALDNVYFENLWGRCGHFAPNGGGWVQQYSGAVDNDPAYINHIVSYVQRLYPAIHAIGGSLTGNFDYDFEDTLSDATTSIDTTAQNLDIIMPEGFVSSIGKGTGNSSVADWLTDMQFLQYVQSSLGKSVFANDYYLYANDLTYEDTAAHENVQNALQWGLANYLLIKENHTYFSLVDEYATPQFPPGFLDTSNPRSTLAWLHPEYQASIGAPIVPSGATTDAMYESQGVYMRNYSNGLVIVNPDPTATSTITLPSNTYIDLYGNTIGSTLAMGPQSGAVLLDGSGESSAQTEYLQDFVSNDASLLPVYSLGIQGDLEGGSDDTAYIGNLGGADTTYTVSDNSVTATSNTLDDPFQNMVTYQTPTENFGGDGGD